MLFTSFSRYLNFCLDFLVIQKIGLMRKIRLVLKFMTSQFGKQAIAIHILPNISRSIDNQTMKFGQKNIFQENIFHHKSYTKCGRETIHRPFSKKIEMEYISRSIVSGYSEGFRRFLKKVTKMHEVMFFDM